MFRTSRLSGASLRISPQQRHEDSYIESFKRLDISVFQKVQEFFRQLGVAFLTDTEKRTITFHLSMDEMYYMEHLQKLTYGVIAFDIDGRKMTVNRVDAAKFSTLSAKDFQPYTAFKSQLPACRINAHPAFIHNYSPAHTSIMEHSPAGTYALMCEENNRYLLVYADGSSKQNNIMRGVRLIENSDGSIQHRNELFPSIHDFLHDGQYITTLPHGYTAKHALGETLAKIIDKNPDLQNQVTAYKNAHNDPEILKIVAFLEQLSKATGRFEESALISAAITLLYLRPSEAANILECLTRVLPDAGCGIINAPFSTFLGGGNDNNANYYRDILVEEMRGNPTLPSDELMKQLSEIYAPTSQPSPQ